ncbi:hypothetical protein [Streptomyces antimicrobicus]|uniref:Uncharacterized protein n=1 Tax=Streptomyces antimicrobicus TaxID=2883108 RepID=A0ABS8BE86_9ACTN|nr:hypothetical protein [Streptomyces antimicrobicus]MCB5182952.1 hypothetical protein [Streptomyces antimicrobicus]
MPENRTTRTGRTEHTEHTERPDRTGRGERDGNGRAERAAPGTPVTEAGHTLRREVPSTLGLLADAQDFAAMRGYDTFPFEDHQDYLRQVDALLASLAAQEVHTVVALFDPDDFADYCADHGLDPDTPGARTRFTAELGGAGLPYTGQPVAELVPLLVDEAVRQATWEYATLLLAGLGACADCGQDIGHASFERAGLVLERFLEHGGPGHHHLVASIPTQDEQLVAVLHADTGGAPGAEPVIAGRDGLDFVTVLAAGIALGGPGGVVLRTSRPGAKDRVHGWRLAGGNLVPLSAAAVFNAYCTDADTGEPVAPEPGVEYCPGFEVDPPGPHH